MLKLDNISKFITFTIDLFNDEFSSYIDYVDSVYYFSNGGCYELAKIIKHYFPDAKFVMKNDYRHCGILYEGKIYDVFDGLTKEQLEEKGIKEDEYIKDINDFKVLTKEEMEERTGRAALYSVERNFTGNREISKELERERM